jgi:hypothetical protein
LFIPPIATIDMAGANPTIESVALNIIHDMHGSASPEGDE